MATTTTTIPTDAHLARARYLGADAALAHATGFVMATDDARSAVAGDIAWAEPPDLSGQWADDPTPRGLAAEALGPDLLDRLAPEEAAAATAALADAWEQGRDLVWADAIRAAAHRTLGDIAAALALDHANERLTDRLRQAAR